MGIKRAVSPFLQILAPYLPVTAILTHSLPPVIYKEVMQMCKEQNWAVTVDKPNGIVRIALRFYE